MTKKLDLNSVAQARIQNLQPAQHWNTNFKEHNKNCSSRAYSCHDYVWHNTMKFYMKFCEETRIIHLCTLCMVLSKIRCQKYTIKTQNVKLHRRKQ